MCEEHCEFEQKRDKSEMNMETAENKDNQNNDLHMCNNGERVKTTQHQTETET